MKVKKILSLVLVGIMMLSMTTTSFAAEVTRNGGTGETVVTYGMDEGFTVTIPTNFTIDESKKATANVSASNVMIAHGKVLEVAVSGDDYDTTGSWELIDEAEATNMLTYTIGSSEGGSNIVNGSVVLDVEAGEAYNSSVYAYVDACINEKITKAGTYTDTLTFTVSVDELITFKVSGTSYQAEKNMTWGEFINSKYNVDNWEVNDGTWAGVIVVSRDTEYGYYSVIEYVTDEGYLDYPTSTYEIIPNGEYSTYGTNI